MSIHRDYFFDNIRHYLFKGSLSQQQVDGMERYLDWYDNQNPPIPEIGHIDDRCLAYIFATMFVETAQTMQPVQEYGSLSYLKSKPYYPWFGRGDVQLTWEDNYRKMDAELGLRGKLIANPDLALDPIISRDICIRGLYKGMFTGKKFADFFTDNKTDWYNARTMVNGHDRASEIADYAEKFHNALGHI